MAWSLCLLGGASLRGADGLVAGEPAQRHRLALLAVLAAAHPRPVSRDRLMALLWPERDTRRGRALLSLSVHVLRRTLGADALPGAGDALGLDAGRLDVDVVGMVAACTDGDPEGAAARWGGPFLDGFHLADSPEFARWADSERERFSGLFTWALAGTAEARRARGDRVGAAEAWRRLGAHDPLGSATAVRVMRGLAALGARAGALEHARRHAAALRTEFDAAPDPAVRALAVRLREPAAVARSAVRALGDVAQADALCTRGRHLWAQRSPDQLRSAIGYFERALAAAPGHAPALAGLADAWSILGFYSHLPPHESFARARSAAARARAASPSASDASASLAYVRLYYDWRWDDAERGLRRALRLEPGNAKAHQWLGNVLVTKGRGDDAVARMRHVRSLAPLLPIANAVPGWACLHAGRLDEAVDHLAESIELDPHFAIGWLWTGQTQLARGAWDAAIRAFERLAALDPGATAELALAAAYAGAGATHAAEERLAAQRARQRAGAYVPAYELAKVELALGRPAIAVTELRRAYQEHAHQLAFLLVDPLLAPLRDHGAVRELASRIGLRR